MKTIAIYPGTFDPITNGHIDLIGRATCLFDQVIVAVARSSAKKTMFSLDERVALVQRVMNDLGDEHVKVEGFSNLMVDFAAEQGARVIVRGLRAVSDFDYEVQLAGMNRKLNGKIETMYLSPDEKYAFLSSSLVRDVAIHGGDISTFVPPAVVDAMQDKLS